MTDSWELLGIQFDAGFLFLAEILVFILTKKNLLIFFVSCISMLCSLEECYISPCSFVNDLTQFWDRVTNQ